jgi:O-methyltransferase
MMIDTTPSNKAAELLFKSIGMQDFSRLVHICHYVLETQSIEGDIVEFGCFSGSTAKLMSFISNKTVHVYDSFEGLPANEENKGGWMSVGIEELVNNFNVDQIRLPVIHKGWFNQLNLSEIPEKISFAHLDGDLYESIIQPLHLIYDKIQLGGVILIDDYLHPDWPGVEKAINEYFADKPESIITLKGINGSAGYKAMIQKLK